MKIFRYFFVGGVSAVIDISLFAIFAGYFKFPWAVVSIITFIIATLTNYFLSIRFVFKSGSRYKKHHEILGVFIEKMNIHLIISKCLTTSMLFLWNYFGRQRFIFSE